MPPRLFPRNESAGVFQLELSPRKKPKGAFAAPRDIIIPSNVPLGARIPGASESVSNSLGSDA